VHPGDSPHRGALLLSQHWIRQQRLSFPIVELPYQMATGGTAFWCQRLMCLGFSLAAGAELLNGLHHFYPSVLQLPLRRSNIALLFTEKILGCIGVDSSLVISVYHWTQFSYAIWICRC
jgi:hypothetical protein